MLLLVHLQNPALVPFAPLPNGNLMLRINWEWQAAAVVDLWGLMTWLMMARTILMPVNMMMPMN